MDALPIHQMSGPTAWAGPPDSYSYSSLTTIEQCPLQWQLLNSTYGPFKRFPVRPNRQSIEGRIVHEVLDLLFRRLSLAGLPAMGSAGFKEVVGQVDVRASIELRIEQYFGQLENHPRAVGLQARPPVQELANRVIHFLRTEYPKASSSGVPVPADSQLAQTSGEISGPELLVLLDQRGALSELRLTHPNLPFLGVIDLIRKEAGSAVLIDFKTGQESSSHKLQVLCYAVLWWRQTGQVPRAVEVLYPDHVVRFEADESILAEEETKLMGRIRAVQNSLLDPPADACIGSHCQYCDVRQFCDTYWGALLNTSNGKLKPGKQDLEVKVIGEPTEHGFAARLPSGARIAVVHPPGVWRTFGPFAAEQSLRIRGAWVREEADAIEVKPWTEVFRGRDHPSRIEDVSFGT